MKLNIVIAAFVMAAAASSALAQSWVAVTKDQDQSQYEIDMGSIAANGGYTQSFMRQVAPKPLKDAVSGKRYVNSVIQRLDDCRTRTFAFVSYAYVDQQGQVVSSQIVPRASWQFNAAPPGSVGAVLQEKVCAVVAQRAALKPSLDTGPTTKTNWLPTAYDPKTQTRYYVRQDSVVGLGDGVVAAILRADSATPIRLPDGSQMTTGFIAQMFACGEHKISTVSVDSYDSVGALVAVYQPPSDKVEIQTYVAGSTTEQLAKYVCDESHIVATEDEGETFVGTGWLGPKGYIITAYHVIEGATLLELARDGKVFGRAELVVADPANDIAILKPLRPLPARIAIAFSAAPAQLGERVFTLGYPSPGTLGMTLKMTSGEVSAMAGNDVATGRRDDARFLQVSMPIHSGNSGGPVIDDQGRAVGIVISKMTKASENEIAQNVNYALKIGYVRNLLSELPAVSVPVSATPRPTISSLVEELQGSVFLVIASSGAASARD
ncbi:serine protease [Phenylobacterium sp.]|uniref:S1C family serine protease n=1 Tax=Phenylobacterium sp. TaxID=1871053 RepID=UPI0030F4981B